MSASRLEDVHEQAHSSWTFSPSDGTNSAIPRILHYARRNNEKNHMNHGIKRKKWCEPRKRSASSLRAQWAAWRLHLCTSFTVPGIIINTNNDWKERTYWIDSWINMRGSCWLEWLLICWALSRNRRAPMGLWHWAVSFLYSFPNKQL